MLVILSIILVIAFFSGTPATGNDADLSFGIYVENQFLRLFFSFLAVVPLILLSAYYASKTAKKEHDKLLFILDMECNPKRFFKQLRRDRRKSGTISIHNSSKKSFAILGIYGGRQYR